MRDRTPGPVAAHRRFLCDAMVGGLARSLRALGFDTAYQREACRRGLLLRALRERRTILTRDTRFGVPPAGALLLVLRANDSTGQLREVLDALEITRVPGPFLRCTLCNTVLRAAAPDEIEAKVPAFVRSGQTHFTSCPHCNRVYWPGTHRRDMALRLSRAVPAIADQLGKPA